MVNGLQQCREHFGIIERCWMLWSYATRHRLYYRSATSYRRGCWNWRQSFKFAKCAAVVGTLKLSDLTLFHTATASDAKGLGGIHHEEANRRAKVGFNARIQK